MRARSSPTAKIVEPVGEPIRLGAGPAARREHPSLCVGVMACADLPRWRRDGTSSSAGGGWDPMPGPTPVWRLPGPARWRRLPAWSATPRRAASVCGAMSPAPVSTPTASHPVSIISDGVQCESCHGPGSGLPARGGHARPRRGPAGRSPGALGREFAAKCHEPAHGKSFDPRRRHDPRSPIPRIRCGWVSAASPSTRPRST